MAAAAAEADRTTAEVEAEAEAEAAARLTGLSLFPFTSSNVFCYISH
jgi:hypothetical protein